MQTSVRVVSSIRARHPSSFAAAIGSRPLHSMSSDSPASDPPSSSSSAGSQLPPAAARSSRTGLYIRARALRALDSPLLNAPPNGAVGVGRPTEQQQPRERPPNPTLTTNDLSALTLSVTPDSASTSSHDSVLTAASGSSSSSSSVRGALKHHLRTKSASLISLASSAASAAQERYIGGDGGGSYDSGSGGGSRRSAAGKLLPRRQMSSYIPAYSSKGVNNDEYRKHNLFPLPPPGHIRPILLPTHAVLNSVDDHTDAHASATTTQQGGDLRIRIDGFVEQWPASVGTGQRVFMQLARQLTNLPRLPRQQPAALGRGGTASGTQTPAAETAPDPFVPSFSAPTTPLHADTDDAVFFPEIPYGVVRRTQQPDEDTLFDGEHDERPGDALARHALALGAPERTIGRVLQGLGALPVESKVDGSGWGERLQEQMHEAQHDVEQAEKAGAAEAAQNITTSSSSSSDERPTVGTPAGPLGGSPFWANRTKDEVEKLWRTLEHRLRCFWTYRKPFQRLTIEIYPIMTRAEDAHEPNRGLHWMVDEYGVANDGGDGGQTTTATDDAPPVPLLAVTDVTSDANGLFTTALDMSAVKLEHYITAYHKQDGKRVSDMGALRMRARMTTETGEVVHTPWQRVNVVHDEAQQVHVICDIDDTVKHTHVLGGARAVARNVFARPFEEVTVPGVVAWFAQLAAGKRENVVSLPLISGWHFVSNAPAECHALTKAYLSAAGLPAGALLLKHYFASKGSGPFAWLQAYLQPASTRKKQNLLRCLDDFSASQFVMIGDSGEMDLDVYCDLARMRPKQVRAIWIRDVGNVSPLAKALVTLRAEGQVQQQRGETDANVETESHDSMASSLSQSTITPLGGGPSRVTKYLPGRSSTRDSYGGGGGGGGTGSGSITPELQTAVEKAEDEADAAGTTTNAATSVSEEFLVRLQRNLNTLPDTTAFRFWQNGYDAIDESVRQIEELKASGQP